MIEHAMRLKGLIEEKLDPNELESLHFYRAPIGNGYMVALDKRAEFIDDLRIKELGAGTRDMDERSKSLIRSLRVGRRFEDQPSYNWLEVMAQVHYILKDILDTREPGMHEIMVSELLKRDLKAAEDSGRKFSVLVKQMASYLKEMA